MTDNYEFWNEEYPREVGEFWFFGDPFTTREEDKKSDFHLVKVKRGSNGFIYITEGSFMFPKSCNGIWQRVRFPEKP
jgi:hypothetical protein